MINLTVNGECIVYDGDASRSLLDFLRVDMNITSAKDGCSPQAACGCCVVRVDDKAVMACVRSMHQLDGCEVVTTEGLSETRKKIYAESFVSCGGLQCGYCIPGIVMQADSLIDRDENIQRCDIVKALTPHLCRCTGYVKIIDSIEASVERIQKDDKSLSCRNVNQDVGTRADRYLGNEFVLGQHIYTDDIRLEGMLYGAIRFVDYPRSRILSIDTRAAKEVEGVISILTADDIPGNRFIGLIEHDWPLMLDVNDLSTNVGDVIALVVAISEDIARVAVNLIDIKCEVMDPITDPNKAITDGSDVIREGDDTNVLSRSRISRGDKDTAISNTVYSVKESFSTQLIEHGFMETESAVGLKDGSGVIVYSQGQGVYEDRKQIAKILNIDESNVLVRMIPNGGAFGGKEDLTVQGYAALAAFILDCPVKVRFNRDESIMMHPKRHPVSMDYDIGCDSDGLLTYVIAKFIGDTGGRASVGMKVMERCAGHACGAYHVPFVDVDAYAVMTNNIPAGAMRGFGVNQANFGLESTIDMLCLEGGFDRWEFRMKNALKQGSMTTTGQILRDDVGLKSTLIAVKEYYDKARFVGISCGIKNTGIGNGVIEGSKVSLEFVRGDYVVVRHGWTEMGQGVNTVAMQAVCSELGLPADSVKVVIDTTDEHNTGMTTASRATSLLCNAIIDACSKIRDDVIGQDYSVIVGKKYIGEWTVDWTNELGSRNEDILTHYSYSYATQLVELDDDGRIITVVAAHDAGKIINPTLFEGQIEGSVHMGLGYAISEELVLKNGVPAHTRLRKCGILRARDMPDIVVLGIEVPDTYGAYGCKGVGEIGLVPTAGAVANAFAVFDRIRQTSLPLRDVAS